MTAAAEPVWVALSWYDEPNVEVFASREAVVKWLRDTHWNGGDPGSRTLHPDEVLAWLRSDTTLPIHIIFNGFTMEVFCTRPRSIEGED